MDISILVIKILAVYLTVSGLFMIFKGKTLPAILKDFFDHPATVYLTGIVLIFLSSMFLIGHNVWNGTLVQTIATIFAWLLMIKGLLYLFVPKKLAQFSTKRLSTFSVSYGLLSLLVAYYLFFLK